MQNSVDWFRKSVIYQVFIDRFNGFDKPENKHSFLGGNIKGIISKLDYFQNLGINVIWISPFYKTTQYHGYHITDFESVDPRFGTDSDLKYLVNKANDKGIKLIADFVPNHCSNQHPFFQDAIKNKNSKYSDWFIFKRWPDEYLCFLDYKELPKINLDNKNARNYMIGIANHWLSIGIGGFRIDHVIGPSHDFWREFRHTIKETHPNAVLIGEVWIDGIKRKNFDTIGIKNKFIRKIVGLSQEKTQLEYYHELDGVLDFALNHILVEHVKQGSNLLSDKNLKAKIKKHFKKTPSDYFMVTFLDNHDMDRFLKHCKGNIDILLDAFKLLFSFNYPVVIYNGTENCSYNEEPVDSSVNNSDLFVREPFDWSNINQDFFNNLRNEIEKRHKTLPDILYR